VLIDVGIALVVAVATCAQVVSGFGLALIAVPVLALMVGAEPAVVGTTIVGPLISTSILVRDRHHIRRRSATIVTAAAIVGMPLGILVLSHASDRALTAIIGVVVVIAGAALWRGVRVPTRRLTEPVAGLISGTLATSTGTSGPPLVIVFHSEDMAPREFRGTLSATFLVQSLVAVFAFWVSGHLTADAVRVAVWSLPGLALGWVVGERLFRGIDQARFRRLVLLLLIATGLVSILRAII
jgi:uncharacterized membrane protein YfcA